MQGHTGDWPHEGKTAIQFALWTQQTQTPNVVIMPYNKMSFCLIEAFSPIRSSNKELLCWTEDSLLCVGEDEKNDKRISLPKICCILSFEEALLAPTGLSCAQKRGSLWFSWWQVAIFKSEIQLISAINHRGWYSVRSSSILTEIQFLWLQVCTSLRIWN